MMKAVEIVRVGKRDRLLNLSSQESNENGVENQPSLPLGSNPVVWCPKSTVTLESFTDHHAIVPDIVGVFDVLNNPTEFEAFWRCFKV